ncbi:MAG: RagB/SusD family nutrient uptake outer membrane protein [Bacteroidales bacterium]|jgi:hypothetical protein|nr:RagB/SusD family nutrient uptake outer membrane protein [Bacteroidales bacterium]
MKKTINYILAAFSAVVLVSSCNLDLFPNGSIAYDEDGALFTNEKELGYLENGLYTSYRSGFYGEYAITEEVMMDGFNASADFGNNYGGAHRADEDFNPSNYEIRDYWSNRYSCIKNYNVFINGVENLPEDYKALGAKAQVVKGEAYFFRASAYLDLIRHYAPAYDPATAAQENSGVPLVLVYDQNAKPTRATVQEVYDQIKEDLDSAAVNLAGVAGAKASQKITIDAVNALYARYYLDVKDYSKAYAKAQEVIASKAGYTLSSSVKEFQNEYYLDNGTEAIVQLYASLTENGSGTNSIYTSMASSTEVKDNKNGRYFNKPYFFPSQKLLDQYEAEDLRLACWFTIDGQNNLTGEKYPTFITNDYTYDVVIFSKYLGNKDLTSSAVLNSRQHVKPLLISEMYLISAEAAFRGANNGDALTALNALQTKRGATPSDEVNATVLYNEWFKETVGEGLHMSTVKRFGNGYSVRTPQPAAVATFIMRGDNYETKSMEPGDYHLNWPIPTNDMQTNKNLVQNAGY